MSLYKCSCLSSQCGFKSLKELVTMFDGKVPIVAALEGGYDTKVTLSVSFIHHLIFKLRF